MEDGEMKRAAALLRLSVGVGVLCGLASGAGAAGYEGYTGLDPKEPVTFDGEKVTWGGKTFVLDENTIFLDSRLEKGKLGGSRFAFNNVKEAVGALKNGTAAKPMMLLTAPGVYWVDDPEDPAIRGGNGSAPVGMAISCNNLCFYGLNSKWRNVVFAVNRGQTQGAAGNFTMFSIQGTGLKSENVTFGNYCNVDLVFPLDARLNRPKRADAIAQAQLFSYNGGDGVAVNSAFVSRLNLLPFARFYKNCHIESSGHAGGGGGQSVYVDSTLEFYGSNFSGGRYYLNCDIYLKPSTAGVRGRSVHRFGFTDGIGAGGVAVDTRFHRSSEMIEGNVAAEISWDKVPPSATTRGYQHNVTLDGKPFVIQEAATPGATVVIGEGSELLKAYKVAHGGQTFYNVPNIFAGVDPFGVAKEIKAAAVAAGKGENAYLGIPMTAALRPAGATGAGAGAGRGGFGGGGTNLTIRSGQTTANLTVSVAPPAYASSGALGKWEFKASRPEVVQVTPGANNTVTVAGTNKTAAPVEVVIVAKNELGLEAAARVTVEPAFVAPPTFSKEPVILAPAEGRVTLGYGLEMGSDLRKDESVITWYRCTDSKGANPLKVAVSRRDKPEGTYVLTAGDVGHYLMATIEPKHSVSDAGPAKTVYGSVSIAKEDVKVEGIDTNMQNVPAEAQPKVLPGTWMVDGWTYGPGQTGSLGYFGLYPTARGARLFYLPGEGKYGEMSVRAKFAPNKNTGQGFGSATNQFMDVYIKYDPATNSGYGLRIQRLTTEEIDALGYKGAGAVAGCAFFLASFEKGEMTPISKKVMSSAFVSECTVELAVKNGKLTAMASSTEETRSGDAYDYLREVQLEAPVEGNGFGGTGTYFTGTVGVNAVLVTGWKATWTK